MIELRWLVKHRVGGLSPQEEKVLQYRNYSLFKERRDVNGDIEQEYVWSEWKDVPTVMEDETDAR